MLPTAARLTDSEDFLRVSRSRSRGASGTMVVYVHHGSGAHARAGFVVSKQVGNSVVRHRVVRRLRAVLAPHLAVAKPGTDLVVRALPAAAHATSAALAADFDAALQRAEGRKRR